MMGIAGGTEKRPQRLRNQLGACHDLAVLTSLTAPRGEAFVKKWGVLRIFIGRFFGPLRAAVPFVAGIFGMPFWPFQLANFSSAFVWAAVLLTLGNEISKILSW